MNNELFSIGNILKSLHRTDVATLYVIVCSGEYHPLSFGGVALLDKGGYEELGKYHVGWNKFLVGTNDPGWRLSSLAEMRAEIETEQCIIIEKGNVIKADGVFVIVSAVSTPARFSGTVLRDNSGKRQIGTFYDDWISDSCTGWTPSSLEEVAISNAVSVEQGKDEIFPPGSIIKQIHRPHFLVMVLSKGDSDKYFNGIILAVVLPCIYREGEIAKQFFYLYKNGMPIWQPSSIEEVAEWRSGANSGVTNDK